MVTFFQSKQPTDKLGQPISQAPNKLQQVITPPKTALTPYIEKPVTKISVPTPIPVSKRNGSGSSSPPVPVVNIPPISLPTQPTDQLGQPISQDKLTPIITPKPTSLSPSLPSQSEINKINQRDLTQTTYNKYKPIDNYDKGISKELNRPVNELEAKKLGLAYIPSQSTRMDLPTKVILPSNQTFGEVKSLTVGKARDYVKNILDKRLNTVYEIESKRVSNYILPSYQEQANKIYNNPSLSEKDKTKQLDSLSSEYSNRVNEVTRINLNNNPEYNQAVKEYSSFAQKYNLKTTLDNKTYYADLEKSKFQENKEKLKELPVQTLSLVPVIGSAVMLGTAETELKYKGNIQEDIRTGNVDINKVQEKLTTSGKIQTGLASAGLILEGGLAVSQTKKALQNIRYEDLVNKKPIIEIGFADKIEGLGQNDMRAVLIARQETPYGKIETVSNIKSLRVGEKEVTIAGKGKQVITIQDINKMAKSDAESFTKTVKDFKFSSEMPLDITKGENILSPIGKKATKQLTEEYSGVSGNILLDIKGEKQLRQVPIGGFNKQVDDLIYSISGKANKIRLNKIEKEPNIFKLLDNIESKGSFEVQPEAKILFKPEKGSIVKVLSEKDKKPLFDLINNQLDLKANIPEEIINTKVKPSDILKSRKDTLTIEVTPERLKELNIKTDIIGGYQENPFSFNPEIKNLILVQKGGGISSQSTERKILHELSHADTKRVFDFKAEKTLNYNDRPSERFAYEIEKLVDNQGLVDLEKYDSIINKAKQFKAEPIKEIESNSQILLQEVKQQSFNEVAPIKQELLSELEKSNLESLTKPRIKPVYKPTGFKSIAELQGKSLNINQIIKPQSNKEITSSSLNEELKASSNQQTKVITASSSNNKLVPPQVNPVKEALKESQVTKQKLKNLSKPLSSNAKFNYPVKPITELDIPFAGFGSGNQEGYGSKELKKLLSKNYKRKPKYTTSLGAALFQEKPIKISEKEFERLSKSIFSGAETRPVLEIVKKKRKV